MTEEKKWVIPKMGWEGTGEGLGLQGVYSHHGQCHHEQSVELEFAVSYTGLVVHPLLIVAQGVEQADSLATA